MNSLLLTGLAWLAPFFLQPLPVGDELKRERLPADVDFVMHFDFEGFKQTELWKQVSSGLDQADLKADLEDFDELRTRFGIDPLTDVRAVTLFKVKSEEDPTVVLFSTTAKVDEALKNFQKEKGYARLSEGGIELHTWKTEDDGHEETVCAYVHSVANGERVVVLASNKESALRSARVLRGEAPSHATAGTLLSITPARGSFLYIAASEIPHLDEFTPASQVFGLAQGIQVDLGEAGGFLRAHMGLATESPEKASDISRFVDGMIALGSLAREELGSAVEFLRALRLNTRGSEVTIDFEFGVQRLVEILKSLDEDEDGDEADEPDEVEVK